MIKHKIIPHSMGLFKTNHGRNFINGRPIPVAYEPMIRNRYVLSVTNQQGILQQFLVRTTTRPSMTQEYRTHRGLHIPTYQHWDPIEFTIQDIIGETRSNWLDIFREWMHSTTESITGRQGYAAGYKRDLILEMLDPTGVTVEKWQLNGCILSSFNHEMFYDNVEGDVNITVVADNARLIF